MLVVVHIRVISECNKPQIGWSYTCSCGSNSVPLVCKSGLGLPLTFTCPRGSSPVLRDASLASISCGVSLALEAAALFLWYASLASVSGGVSFAHEAADLSLWYASLASVPCGVLLALKRAFFVAAEDSLPIGTFFCWVECRNTNSESMCINVCWREYRFVRMERVAIGKNEMSGLCNEPRVETHTYTHTCVSQQRQQNTLRCL
jgi:hypothetical protein